MPEEQSWLIEELERRGVSRRDFMSFCGVMASVMAMPKAVGAKIADAIETKQKPTLVWLEFQDCAGNTESFLRASRPAVADIILDTISVDYHETIMAAAGHQAEERLAETIAEHEGSYIAVVEGSIPTGANGAYCTVGGRAAIDIAREVCGGAAATIAIGTCAAYGGIPAAAPNPTGALSVADAVPRLRNLINLPACPANAENLAAVIVYYITFDRLPPTDRYGRPLFAYGKSIHDNCERRAHYDAGQYVEQWGDQGHRTGYCLYKMGCKGPVTYQNCPNIRWNEGTSWPIGCGHPCIGCAEPDFWDTMTPFYQHLSGFPGFGMHSNIDKVGFWGALGVGAAFATHSLVKLGQRVMHEPAESSEAETPQAGGGESS
ncbi:MAG: hydrogenase small subunit [Thermoanaerobaculia bacterium]|nr:hydrogenase small subunit [Thermoanaerobaculia bacterium]